MKDTSFLGLSYFFQHRACLRVGSFQDPKYNGWSTYVCLLESLCSLWEDLASVSILRGGSTEVPRETSTKPPSERPKLSIHSSDSRAQVACGALS